MNSCFYEGQVRHRRFTPKPHAFDYRIFYVYLDLDELETVFSQRWFWSTKKMAPARFCRADHLGDKGLPLKQAVADAVEQQTGVRPQGPIRLLTHLRYFGFVFNPVSFYYCFDTTGTKLETIVAEVNNTPWGEQHIYVLPQNQNTGRARHARFALAKEFHVSPFMPMDMHYNWALTTPEQQLGVHMQNYHADTKIFDATLALHQKSINAKNCASMLLRYPLMTVTVITAIYLQALKLLFKGTPVYDHPEKIDQRGADSAKT
jgi:uncharacterized protein